MHRPDDPIDDGRRRDVATALWRCFDERRFRDALPLLSERFEAHWPNTRERIVGRENFIALNENYPGDSRCTVRRVEECDDAVVTITEIRNGDTVLFAVSFFEVQDGRIVRAEEYFADNGSPPYERSQFAERY